MKIKDKFKDIRGFQKCIDLLSDNPEFKKQLEKRLSPDRSKDNLRNEKTCITSFIEQLYEKNKKFDLDLFNEFYEKLEEFLYNKSKFQDIVNLYNFDVELEEIILRDNLVIRKINELEMDYLHRLHSHSDIHSWQNQTL